MLVVTINAPPIINNRVATKSVVISAAPFCPLLRYSLVHTHKHTTYLTGSKSGLVLSQSRISKGDIRNKKHVGSGLITVATWAACGRNFYTDCHHYIRSNTRTNFNT